MQETTSAREGPSIVLEALLGEGTFGKVYSGELAAVFYCLVSSEK
jgi:hypothetical protein